MITMAAENEDTFFEKTGVELGYYSACAHGQGMLNDEEFKKVIANGQVRIQAAQ